MSEGKYTSNIVTREFSDAEAFGLQTLVSEDITIIGIDAFTSDLQHSRKTTPQQRFLQRLKALAKQRDIGFLPLRSHLYNRKAVMEATPRLKRASLLPEAAAYFFERRVQAGVAKRRVYPGYKYLFVMKPKAHSIFTHYMKEKAQPSDSRPKIESVIDLYARELFRYAYADHEGRSKFMGQHLNHEERCELIMTFEVGYREVKRCLDWDQENIFRKGNNRVNHDYELIAPFTLP